MNILKAIAVAVGTFVALLLVGSIAGGFLGTQRAYALGQMLAPVYLILTILAFIWAKKKFDRRSQASLRDRL